MMRILLVVSDGPERARLGSEFRRAGFVVELASSSADARSQLDVALFDLLIVDENFVDGTGTELVAAYRASGGGGHVIAITDPGRTEARVTALENGSDDVVSRPVDLPELRARIRALQRRPTLWSPEVYRVGDLVVDCDRRCVSQGENTVSLTPTEWVLLRQLAMRPGRIVPRDTLVREAWGDNHDPAMHALDVHISCLRQKLAAAGSTVQLVTRRSIGYQLLG